MEKYDLNVHSIQAIYKISGERNVYNVLFNVCNALFNVHNVLFVIKCLFFSTSIKFDRCSSIPLIRNF